MKKYLAEGLVIFGSIFASFSVENIRQNSIEKEILNEAVITLGDEIESNIEYTKEHLKQVRNMHYVMDKVYDEFDNIKLNDVYNLHSNNPYIFRIIENGNIEYNLQYNDSYYVLAWWNAWEPEDVFFQSMLYSGKLLEIKNKKLRKEIESIYTKQEERINGMTLLTKNRTERIVEWFENERNKFDEDIRNDDLFNKHKNQKLKNLISLCKQNLNSRVSDLENYLQALNNVVLLISSEYKQLD
tara:strand:+ start:1062 stop:1787 length:726 start_codon:yes stop_codon:yes gene_type:complete